VTTLQKRPIEENECLASENAAKKLRMSKLETKAFREMGREFRRIFPVECEWSMGKLNDLSSEEWGDMVINQSIFIHKE